MFIISKEEEGEVKGIRGAGRSKRNRREREKKKE